MATPVLILLGFLALGLMLFGPLVLGAVLIQERQVGVIVKRFGRAGLAPGRFIALEGEPGYHVGVESLGVQGYTVMQLMQIIGDRNVRIVPDMAVSGANGSTGWYSSG